MSPSVEDLKTEGNAMMDVAVSENVMNLLLRLTDRMERGEMTPAARRTFVRLLLCLPLTFRAKSERPVSEASAVRALRRYLRRAEAAHQEGARVDRLFDGGEFSRPAHRDLFCRSIYAAVERLDLGPATLMSHLLKAGVREADGRFTTSPDAAYEWETICDAMQYVVDGPTLLPN